MSQSTPTVPVPRDQVERIIPMLKCFHADNTTREADALQGLLAAHPCRTYARETTRPKRNENAAIIQGGACNPIPIIRALSEGLDELRAEQTSLDTQAILDDPALRLIVHQLAYLMKVGGGYDIELLEYSRLTTLVAQPQ